MTIIHWEMRNKRIKAFGYTFKSTTAEYRWACYLEMLKKVGAIKSWKYEPKTFEFGERWRVRKQYTPDFLIEDEGGELYYEIKTSLRQKDVTRFRCLAADFPEVKITLVIFGPEYTGKVNQNRLRSNARKYLYQNKIIFANPILKKFGL